MHPPECMPIPVARSLDELEGYITDSIHEEPLPAIIFRGNEQPLELFETVGNLKPLGVNPEAYLSLSIFREEIT